MDLNNNYKKFGCTLNSVPVKDLFEKYETLGFIYPAKKKLLKPHYDLILSNWEAATNAGFLRILSHGNINKPPWGSLTSWFHSTGVWTTQHLIGTGGPAVSRALLLCQQASYIEDSSRIFAEIIFQRKNRFANRIFGSIDKSLEIGTYFLHDFSYLAFPKSKVSSLDKTKKSEILCEIDVPLLNNFLDSQRSPIFTSYTGIDKHSMELKEMNELYQSAGLFRYRKIYIHLHDSKIVGCVIAYRGPLGFNFSFLENRCELIIDKDLPKKMVSTVINSLLTSASSHYDDFEPDCIYIITDSCNQKLVEQLGGQFLRVYTQSILERAGYQGWYNHVDGIFERVNRMANRSGNREGNK